MTKVKSFTKLEELELGDFVGVFSEDDYNITEFLNKACSTYAELSSSLMSIIAKEDTVIAWTLARLNGTTLSNLHVHVADIVYVGNDINGQKIPLTARLVYPYNIAENTLKLTNIYIDNHPTIFIKDTEPTRTFNGYSPVPTCLKGYLVVQPDLVGFGATANRTQQYIDVELNGAAIAYSVVAAQQFATWAATREKYGFNLLPEASIINVSASQGATSALAGTYFMENKLDKTKYSSYPSISVTRICAGAYSMETCMNAYCKDDTLAYACKLPMILAGLAADYPEVLGDYTAHDLFSSAMNNYVYTDSSTGISYGNVWQMLDLKELGSEEIENALYAACPSTITQAASFHKMLAPDLFDSRDSLDWTSPKMSALKKFCDRTNFSSTSLWTPKSPIEMVHDTNDSIIPYSVAQEFYNNQNTGSFETGNITFTTVTDVPAMGRGSVGPHMICCAEWYLS